MAGIFEHGLRERQEVCVLKTPADSRFISTLHVKVVRWRGSERDVDSSWSSSEVTAEFFKQLSIVAYVAVQVAARSKVWVCGSSLTGIAGSNPAGGMDVSFECCVLSGRDNYVGLIARPGESYRVWCV